MENGPDIKALEGRAQELLQQHEKLFAPLDELYEEMLRVEPTLNQAIANRDDEKIQTNRDAFQELQDRFNAQRQTLEANIRNVVLPAAEKEGIPDHFVHEQTNARVERLARLFRPSPVLLGYQGARELSGDIEDVIRLQREKPNAKVQRASNGIYYES